MLNLFAASGHINYAKSARLYVKNMQKLHVEYPWVYRNFAVNEYHAVRRSDRYWSGLWTDLIIEQVMKRSLKTSGGITRGRGITESVRQLWIGSMHRTASVHDVMSNLTKDYRKASEQHIDLSTSRVNRDDNDYKEVLSWFSEHDPFNQDQSLKSLSTGLVANERNKINCDTAQLVGYNIQQSLDNNTMNTAKIKRGEKVCTLQDLQPSVKLKNQTYVVISPLTLLSRLIAIARDAERPEEVFQYELTPEPTSLFKDGMMRKPKKSTLHNSLLDSVPSKTGINAEACVIDGGALLHKVAWPSSSIYGTIVKEYLKFIKRKFNKCAKISVVFDSYDEKYSTKNYEHTRRNVSKSLSIQVSEKVKATSRREVFLLKKDNKDHLIKLLSKCLIENDIIVRRAQQMLIQ